MHIDRKPDERCEVDWLCKGSHNQSYAKKIVMRSSYKIHHILNEFLFFSSHNFMIYKECFNHSNKSSFFSSS